MSTAQPTPAVRNVTLANGVTLPCVDSGEGTGLPLILLHGFTDSWYSFAPVLPHLPRGVRAIAVTQRGHGDASRPPAGYAPLDFANDLAAFMDALGIDRAVIAGHSMGSVIAQQFALAHPQRTAGLALLGAMRTYRGNALIEGLREAVVAGPIDEAFVRDFQTSTLAQPVPHGFFETVVRESLKVPQAVWQAGLDDFLAVDNSDDLHAIAAPALILWGDKDGICSHAEQMALVRSLQAAQLVAYRGAGHALHWEQPERCAADLASFVHACARTDPAARVAA